MIKTEELNKFINRYKLLEGQLNASISDKDEYIKISKEYKELKYVIDKKNEYEEVLSNISEAKDILKNEKDKEMLEIANLE